MKVFITWSGEQSKRLGEAIRAWLPAVIQAVKPYFSPDDIAKGSRWANEVARELEECRFGLLCITRDNLEAPWVMFEAGALSKTVDRANVCPILFGLEPTDLQGPLTQFQAAKFEKSEMKRVVTSLNAQLGEIALPTEVIDLAFEMWWPKLETDVAAVIAATSEEPETPVRSDREILEEILQLSRRAAIRAGSPVITATRPTARLAAQYSVVASLAAAEDCSRDLLLAIRGMAMPLEFLIRRTHPPESRQVLTGTIWEASRLLRRTMATRRALAALGADTTEESGADESQS